MRGRPVGVLQVFGSSGSMEGRREALLRLDASLEARADASRDAMKMEHIVTM